MIPDHDPAALAHELLALPDDALRQRPDPAVNPEDEAPSPHQANGYKVGCTLKNIAVSKLSSLQKRVLIYTREAMPAKGQVITAAETVIVCVRAPVWLN